MFNITLNDNTVTAAAIIGILGLAAWGVYKGIKDEKSFEEYKSKRFKTKDLDKMIQEASILNEDLDVEDGAEAFEVLLDAKHEITRATNKKSLDAALDRFYEHVDCLHTAGTKKSKKAYVLYLRNMKKHRKDQLDRQAEYQRWVKEREFDLNKVKTIASTVSDVTKIAKQVSPGLNVTIHNDERRSNGNESMGNS